MIRTRHLPALLAPLALAACATTPAPGPSPQDAFWSALSSHCGKAYTGGMASEDARDADWAGKRMVAHWAECSEARIAIAFHVEDTEAPGGWNRSRTWIVTRGEIVTTSEPGTKFLTLKHDHRHADGESDAVTFYGGTTGDRGTATAQNFPVDRHSIDLFQKEGLDASLTNVWRIEIDPAGTSDARFVYQLTRRNDPTRRFRVEFDASEPAPAPPPAWGW
ncbi:hypothetical protein [Qipengyuania zhejiangensis]|uniref:hypothetical protein n=1 Tax=Qipengyuania zhejiangensis TaxID=3077782 RepID=UPI002D7A3C93|nr:hypothetical protein [Qipengyuania sp. Z2]